MKTIVIKTQKEMDALPSKFVEYTVIEIRSEELIIVSRAYDNSTVEAWDNSTVKAYGNSTVKAWDNSTVEAWGNSTVMAYDNSTVRAYGNSTVRAYGNSTVRAYGNSTVEAYDNSTVEAWDNSTVKAYGNSTVKAWDNSTVEAWDNSTVNLFLSAYVIVLSSGVLVKRLLDYSTAVFKGCKENIEEKAETALVREIPEEIDPGFDEWLRRGYVIADGIHKKLKSKKTIGDVSVFECEDFPKKTTSYVARRGDLFSHGETVEKAIEDLRYKVGNRDTSEFENWRGDLDKEVSFEDAVAAYRTITGACEYGVKEFVKSIQMPDKLTPKVIVELTRGHYGHDSFIKFLTPDKERES